MKKEKNYPIVRYVHLNNKARKGNYVYVKLNKNDTPSYYKRKKGLTKKDYLTTKQQGIVVKKKGAQKRATAQRYLQQIKKQKTIEHNLGKGITNYTIKNFERINPYGIRVAYLGLLTNKQQGYKRAIVKDKQLAEILARRENVEKYKHRLEYTINLKGQKEELLATITSAHKGKTIENIKEEIGKHIKIGMEIKEQGSPNFATTLKGYNTQRYNTGKVKTIEVKITFRKG